MKRFILSGIVLLSGLQMAAKADLGGADITGPSGDTTTGQTYKARCGVDKKKCTVGFVDGKLMVNNKGGIYRDQFVSVQKVVECTQRTLLFGITTSCFEDQYDTRFTITYDNSQGQRRTALITFMPRYLHTMPFVWAKEFERDLQVWMEDILRPIGPSVQVEGPRQQPPSRRPKSKQPVISCKAPLSDYECNWEKYLEANPNIKVWAEANPAMARKERIRLGVSED